MAKKEASIADAGSSAKNGKTTYEEPAVLPSELSPSLLQRALGLAAGDEITMPRQRRDVTALTEAGGQPPTK